MRAFAEFLRPTQAKLFKMLRKMYRGKTFVSEKNFILVHGTSPVMLVAHLDTVHAEPVKTICRSRDKNVLMSPQGIGGDDRCGVFALVKVFELAEKKTWLLFTCDEETGGLGASMFCKAYKASKLPDELNALKFIVEIDRRGSHDAVYYDCENFDFERYVTSKGFQTAYGSFSDISFIAPELGVAAVNLSCGYYNAHTQHEYIVLSELEHTIEKVVEMVADADNCPKFSYVEKIVKRYDWLYGSKANLSVTCSELGDELFVEEDERKKLPREYELIYDDLLEFYTSEELERYRELYGDQILYQIYIDEYGPFYAAR